MGMDIDKTSIVLMQLDRLVVEKKVRMPYDAALLLSYVAKHLTEQRVVVDRQQRVPLGCGRRPR